MTGVDYGSKEIKWFDGKNFGKGLPSGKRLTVGLSSATTFVKEATFPFCRGRQLEKLVINEVVADLSVEPSSISVAYCPVEKLEKGCRILIFVEKRELVESLPRQIRESSVITLDAIGAAATVSLLYPEGELSVVDWGASKVALLKFTEGRLRKVEVSRSASPEELLERLKDEKRIILTGGGALEEKVRELLSELPVEVPELDPFGRETPLYFNAFGLYNFRKASCKAAFSQPTLFSSEFFEKNRKLLIRFGAISLVSLVLLTGAELIRLQVAKRDYTLTRKAFNQALSKLLGEKVLLPEVQIPQKLRELEQLKELLRVGQPSALNYLKAISESTVKGVKVLEVSGSASSEQFIVIGRSSSDDSLKAFIRNLKTRFQKVSLSVSQKGKFKINLWRVKVEPGQD